MSRDTGCEQALAATIEASAFLDSVIGEFEYDSTVTNDSPDRIPLYCFALYPLEGQACQDITRKGSEHHWRGFQGCSERIDVAGWMAQQDSDSPVDPRSHGLLPGERLAELRFTSLQAPAPGFEPSIMWLRGPVVPPLRLHRFAASSR